jgi:hypothetical protein
MTEITPGKLLVVYDQHGSPMDGGSMFSQEKFYGIIGMPVGVAERF